MLPRPVLKRFVIRVLKDRATGDNVQVPAAGALADFYQQGATVKVAGTVPSTGSVTIYFYNVGALAGGNTLQLELDATKTMTVIGVDATANTAILGSASVPGGIPLAVGKRLVLKLPQVALFFQDPLGETTGATSATADSQGWVIGYVKDYRFDYIVSGTGLTAQLYPDAEGSWVMR